MAYTVNQVAAMSSVSVRTLHSNDETGRLKPAYVPAHGYRLFQDLRLLILQQNLLDREIGFELKRIRKTLIRDDFEVTALRSHGNVLQRR